MTIELIKVSILIRIIYYYDREKQILIILLFNMNEYL